MGTAHLPGLSQQRQLTDLTAVHTTKLQMLPKHSSKLCNMLEGEVSNTSQKNSPSHIEDPNSKKCTGRISLSQCWAARSTRGSFLVLLTAAAFSR